MIKKILLITSALVMLNSCAKLTAEDWGVIEQGLRDLNCTLYQQCR